MYQQQQVSEAEAEAEAAAAIICIYVPTMVKLYILILRCSQFS
jgi:hypothetical protein